jgi:ribokinase
VLLLQLELPEAAVLDAARIARQAGATVILNPAPAVSSAAAFAGVVDYVVPNEHEVSQWTGDACDGESAARAARTLQTLTGARGVVLTLGARGVLVLEDGRSELINAHRVECVDSVGAGDAFCGALAARLAAGASLVDAAHFGNAAGALAVSRAGAEPSMPARDDVMRLLAGGAAVRGSRGSSVSGEA